jgi:tetratricopeptide (TPR) repeat protein
MKKIVSAIIICAMLLATLLAVVPASAADPTRDDLKALIDAVEALDGTKYTKVTWDALKKPLDEAKKVYDDASQPSVMVKISYQQLESVYKALKVETKEIKALIEKAEDLVESDYTPESWTAFQAILDQVRIDSATNDVATVDAAIVTLTEALDTALVALPVEDAAVAELDELVKLAGLLVPTDYSDSAWGMVAMKLEQAAATKAKPTITGMDTAIQQLNTALCNLTVDKVLPIPAVPDVTPLANILKYIDENFEESMFTAESWAALKGPYDEAVALRDAAVKHDELCNKYNDLYKAYTKARDGYIAYAEEIDKAQSRYEEALRDKEKGEATDADVEAALEVLEAAKAEAVEPKAARDAALAAVEEVISEIIAVARKGEEVEPVYTALNNARKAMVEKPEEPTEEPTEVPTEPVETTGCGGVIGATAVVITAVLGLGITVLGKKH